MEVTNSLRNLYRMNKKAIWVGVVSGLITATIASAIYGWIPAKITEYFRIKGYSAQISSRILNESLENIDTLLERISIADSHLSWLVKREQMVSEYEGLPDMLPSLFPDPYCELGARLRRDLGKCEFKTAAYESLMNNAHMVSGSFLVECEAVYDCIDAVGRMDDLYIGEITRTYETFADVGVAAMYGTSIFRRMLGGLEGSYLLCYERLQELLEKRFRGLECPSLPEDLYWFEYIVEETKSRPQ